VTLGGTGRVVGDLWSEGRGWILVGVAAGNLLSLGGRLAFPALLPQIKAEFLLSNATAGLLLGVLWVSFATAQLPGGVLTDRVGERNTVVASMLTTAAAAAIIVVSPGLPAFLAGLALFGFGTGLYGTPRITVLADVYPDRAATAISVSSAVGNVGNAAFPVIATILTSLFAWRIGVGASLPGFVLLAGWLWVVVPARTSPREGVDGDRSLLTAARRTVAAVAHGPVLLATGTMVCLGFVWQGFTAFLPTYLVTVKGIPQSTAAATLGAFFVGGAVVQPFAGGLADRYGERRLLVPLAAVTALSLAAFPLARSTPAFFALALVASLQLAFWPVALAYIPRALPDDTQGSGFGLLRTLFLYVGATGPVVVGALGDLDRFDESFFLLAGVAALTVGLAALLPDLEE
jgi:MFS family permease